MFLHGDTGVANVLFKLHEGAGLDGGNAVIDLGDHKPVSDILQHDILPKKNQTLTYYFHA